MPDDAVPRSRPRTALANVRRGAKAARSGLKRYPREFLASVRSARRAVLGYGQAEVPALGDELAAAWIGHATTLLRLGGVTILTDPVFSHRIGMCVGGVTLGLPRLMPAPWGPDRMAPPDLILISHAHFDHLDKPSLRRLANPKTTVVTARRTAALIPEGFGNVIEVDWNHELKFGDLTIEAVRPAHWGARTALDLRRGYNSYVLRTDDHGVLFAGDTAYTEAFNRVKGVTLAILGIGSYDPWEHTHATPEQAWSMFKALGAGHMLPVHHSTFAMGDEPAGEPMQRLLTAAGDGASPVIRAEPGNVWHRAP